MRRYILEKEIDKKETDFKKFICFFLNETYVTKQLLLVKIFKI
jgi:hypothetical protein